MRPKLSRRGWRHFREDARGANLVEAAIVTPLLLLLTFAVVEFSMLFYAYLALESGVNQASRYAVTGNVVAGSTRQESIMAAMREATPTLTLRNEDFSFEHLVGMTGTVWQPGIGGPDDIGKVTVTYAFQFYTPFSRLFFDGGSLTLQVQSAMKNERRFE
jgi:hypothetical protein